MTFNDLAIDYNVRVMENELEELLEYFEDKKNVVNLLTFYDKKDINYDLLMMIYNRIVSYNGNIRHKSIMTELGTLSNMYERIARIMEV